MSTHPGSAAKLPAAPRQPTRGATARPLVAVAGSGPNTETDAGLARRDSGLDAVPEQVGLHTALRALAPRHRYVVCASFLDGRTQHQIAADLNTTQPNVCRLRKQALRLLYEQLGPG